MAWPASGDTLEELPVTIILYVPGGVPGWPLRPPMLAPLQDSNVNIIRSSVGTEDSAMNLGVVLRLTRGRPTLQMTAIPGSRSQMA